MSQKSWEVLVQVSGSAKAEILRGLLEAQGINVVLSQEGIGESIYPVTVGPLSEIQILVPDEQFQEAQQILADYESGVYENLSNQGILDEPKDPPSDQG